MLSDSIANDSDDEGNLGFGMTSKSGFPHNSLSPLPTSNASRRISSHTLTVTATKCSHHLTITAPRSPLVDQINPSATWFAYWQIGQ